MVRQVMVRQVKVRRAMMLRIAVTVAGLIGLSAGAAAAQDVQPSTIIIDFPFNSTYEVDVFTTLSDGARGPAIINERVTGEQYSVELDAGCYAVGLRSIAPPAGWSDPVSNQPGFCLAPGETETFETGGLLPSSSGRPIHNGYVITPDEIGLEGVNIDVFVARDGVTEDELRLADHQAMDYRGEYRMTLVTGSGGRYIDANVLSGFCYLQTFTAPDGYVFETGRFLTRTSCPNEDLNIIAYPVAGAAPAEFGTIRVDVGDGNGTFIDGFINPADDNVAPARVFWTRRGANRQFRVPPGCYRIRLVHDSGDFIWDSSGRAEQELTQCVESGQRVDVQPVGASREVSYDLTLPILVGRFVAEDGSPVAGINVDLFYPVDGITDEELRDVDHQAADYRGAYYTSGASSTDGTYAEPVYDGCLVATYVAPDGYQFVTGTYLQQTRCQDDGLVVVELMAPQAPGKFTGEVVTESGSPVPGVLVDVFTPVDGITDEELRNVDHRTTDYRAAYLTTAATGDDGRYRFEADDRCLVITYIAPDGIEFETGLYLRQTLCPGDSPSVVVPDPADPGQTAITGLVSGGPEAVADLFAANGDGSRGVWLGDQPTSGGEYRFPVAPGCYVTVLIAPTDYVFDLSGSIYQEMAACVAAGETATNAEGQLVVGR